MRKLQIVLIAPLSAILLACNAAKEETISPTRTQWQFDSYSCAFGCDPMLDEVLKQRIGNVLDFKSPQTGFDLFSECGGTLSLKETNLRNEELLEQLNQTVSPDQQFTVENSGLKNSTVNTAQAVCNEQDKTSSTFWVVSLNDERMTVYFEGASFLNFKAIGAN